MTSGIPEWGRAAEVEDLRTRLADAEETLRAIRQGEADALVVAGRQGDEIHYLGGMERVYRQFIEAIAGSATVSADGEILSCDEDLAATLGLSLDQVAGSAIWDHLPPDEHQAFSAFLSESDTMSSVRRINLMTAEGRLQPAYVAATLLRGSGTRPVVTSLTFMDLATVVSAEEALQESASQLEQAMTQAPVPMMIHAEDGEVLAVNRAWVEISGYSLGDTATTTIWAKKAFGKSEEWAQAIRNRLFATDGKTGDRERMVRTAQGEERVWDFRSAPLGTTADGRRLVITTAPDITERRQAELFGELGREILQVLNEPGDLRESVRSVIAAVKMRTGIDAVGIRLQDGDDYPYFAEDGFSDEHGLTENTLVVRGECGSALRDADGNVLLECTCGLVLSDKADPLLTPGGSFWTNDSLPPLDLPSGQDPRLHPRNECMCEGYTSMALVPIRGTDGIVGLIHLSDRRRGRFSLEVIELLEGIAAHIGEALMRKKAETSLLERNTELEQMILDVTVAMGRIVEARDPYTQGHQERVAALGKLIAQEMRLPADSVAGVAMAGVLHDIGKMRVPVEILTKPGKISESEFALVKQHSQRGYDILSGIAFRQPVAVAALQHHERMDGSGYPQGLLGEDICLTARILAVADVVEAIASDRPYRSALGVDAAIAEIVAHPAQYDSDVVAALLALRASGRIDL